VAEREPPSLRLALKFQTNFKFAVAVLEMLGQPELLGPVVPWPRLTTASCGHRDKMCAVGRGGDYAAAVNLERGAAVGVTGDREL